jgi:hypothetical protein
MTTVELFQKLDTSQKDKLCDDLINFGVIHELNPAAWNRTLKSAIKNSRGTLKKLYQSFKQLEPAQRSRFFQAMIDEAQRQYEQN